MSNTCSVKLKMAPISSKKNFGDQTRPTKHKVVFKQDLQLGPTSPHFKVLKKNFDEALKQNASIKKENNQLTAKILQKG